MISVYLTKIKTRDGVVLEGIVVEPKPKSQTALVWLHGLSSRFSSGQTLIREFSSQCRKNGIGYFKFNNRGHDIVNRDGPVKTLAGGGLEKFEECILDIRAVIRFARELGYRKIILAGHSTGANKALYYMYRVRDHSVKGLLLLGPISDIAAETKKIGARELARRLSMAKRLYKKNPQARMPITFGEYNAGRYISLFQAGSREDVFPYYDPKRSWKELKSVRIPLAVIVGSRDEYLDRSTKELITIFGKQAHSSPSFSGIVLRGANHGFRKKEKELSIIVTDWIQTILINGL